MIDLVITVLEKALEWRVQVLEASYRLQGLCADFGFSELLGLDSENSKYQLAVGAAALGAAVVVASTCVHGCSSKEQGTLLPTHVSVKR